MIRNYLKVALRALLRNKLKLLKGDGRRNHQRDGDRKLSDHQRFSNSTFPFG